MLHINEKLCRLLRPCPASVLVEAPRGQLCVRGRRVCAIRETSGKNNILSKQQFWARAMAQWLRELTVLIEDLDSVSSTHVVTHNHL